MSDRPLCECHGEPKYWRRDPMRAGGGKWQCAVKVRAANARWAERNRERIVETNRLYREENREKVREVKTRWYANLSGVRRNHRLLRARRQRALKRQAQRRDRLAEDRQETANG